MVDFDAVVGNPPYQSSLDLQGRQTQTDASWLYYRFQVLSDYLGHQRALIYPFGNWFDNLSQFDNFGHHLLTDQHTVSISVFEGSNDKRAWFRVDKTPRPVFDTMNISTGVSIVHRADQIHDHYTYSNRTYSDSVVERWTQDTSVPVANPLFTLADQIHDKPLIDNITHNVFKIESRFAVDYPELVAEAPTGMVDPIRLLVNDSAGSRGRAKWFYTERANIKVRADLLPDYKVIMPSAYPKQKLVSSGSTVASVQKRASQIIEIVEPGEAFGRNRLMLYHAPERYMAENFVKYTRTRFFAYLVLNEPNKSATIGFLIPQQDFSSQSDIDWAQSIEQIDKQLFVKYEIIDIDNK